MYNLNTVEGKESRIKEIERLVSLVGEVPGNYIGYLDARAISQYLIDIKVDLEKQLNK